MIFFIRKWKKCAEKCVNATPALAVGVWSPP